MSYDAVWFGMLVAQVQGCNIRRVFIAFYRKILTLKPLVILSIIIPFNM
jgi:hypothetical protein